MKHERRFGVKSRLLISFLSFTVFIILCLWILEVVFLNDIYKSIKINTVQSASARLDGMDREEMSDFVVGLAASDSICSAIYDAGMNRIASEHAGGQCVVHNISTPTAQTFYQVTASCESGSFESYLPADEIMEVLRKNNIYQNFFSFSGRMDSRVSPGMGNDENSFDCVLHCQVAHDSDGNEIFFMLSTMIIPVDSTVQTIRFELILITALLLVISVVMAVFLSRTISRPIIRLNEAAKSLPAGQFDPAKAKGYREVDELGQTLRLASEEIGKVDRLRRELIANVSHDLRTPLTLISGYSEVMRDLPGENTPENLQIVIDETNRLSSLVTDMLDLSKLEAGMDQIRLEEVNLTALIDSILFRYKKLVDREGFVISFEHGETDAWVFADSLKLSQAIYNLVNNAVNYCGADKAVIVRQTVGAEDVRIEVIDHGEGIEEEKLREIWERYYRVDKNHKAASVGSGLGLSIVKKVLELHNARFGVDSRIGEGSRFWFEMKRISPAQKR